MNISYHRDYACCFTGHRPHKLPFLKGDKESPEYVALERRLTYEILAKVITHDCDTFFCGMARGIDMMCAQLVMDIRRAIGSSLKLVCVVPYLGQAEDWESGEKEQYKTILKGASEKILISREYTNACMEKRNRYMVDCCAHMIAVYGGGKGGTKNTLDYACEKNLSIIKICPCRP